MVYSKVKKKPPKGKDPNGRLVGLDLLLIRIADEVQCEET